jgi:N-acetylglutamate synthase-like GNAT family acetyltransferase
MKFRRLDPAQDAGSLRQFLSAADPADYLLDDLAEWVREDRLWVGEEEGEWVAFGRLHDLGRQEGWISGIRITPRRQGHGLGGQLLGRLLSDALRQGVTSLRVVIEDENIASRRLFGHFGFLPVVPLTLRCGSAATELSADPFHRARPDEHPHVEIGWLPALVDRVDLLPGSDGGRFGGWRSSLLTRWAAEGKLYVGSGLAVAVQVDWGKSPRTLWVNPLQGSPTSLLPALGKLTQSLGHEQWQSFLPSTEPLRAEYAACGAAPHPYWGDRVQLYERFERGPAPRGARSEAPPGPPA